MLRQFEEITKEISALILSEGDETKINQLIKEQDDIVKKLTDDEVKELLSRNIPSQYKAKINKLRRN